MTVNCDLSSHNILFNLVGQLKYDYCNRRHLDNSELKQRRRQRRRQKTIGLISKTTALHVHHAFLYISLPSRENTQQRLKIEVFRHFPRTANIKKSRDKSLAVRVYGSRFTFVRLDSTPEVSDSLQGFQHPKASQSHVSKKIRLFRTFSFIDY